MIRIFVCDNDIAFMDHIEETIHDRFNSENIYVNKFQYPKLLIEEVRKNPCDIIIMNTEFSYSDGITVAKEIRTFDNAVKIIFIASDTKYCLESYSVNAFGFMLKHINTDDFCALVQRCIVQISNDKERFICLPIKSGFIKTDCSSIEYIDVYNKNIEYHFTNGETASCTGYIKNIEENVKKFPCFYRILRSCIINMDHVSKFEHGNIHMHSGDIISVGKNKSKEVKEHIYKWLTEK